MHTPSVSRPFRPVSLALVALETLPCGCVAGTYQARPGLVEVELVEAKGPYCLFAAHRMGRMSRLGLADDWDSERSEASEALA